MARRLHILASTTCWLPPKAFSNPGKEWQHSTALALFPHATILITTRGFASATRSLYGQVVRIGGDQPFWDFIKFTVIFF